MKRDKVLYKFINKMECVTNSVSTDRLVYDWPLKRRVFVVLSHFPSYKTVHLTIDIYIVLRTVEKINFVVFETVQL